jgi:hypothetical protein
MSTYTPTKHAAIFGRTYLEAFTSTPVLVIGTDVWTRQEVAALGLTQTVACGNLTKIAKSLGVHSTADLFERTSPYSFTEFRAGVATLYVLFAAFADKGLDPTTWYQRKRESEVLVTFHAFKLREQKARQREREDAAKQKHARRRR